MDDLTATVADAPAPLQQRRRTLAVAARVVVAIIGGAATGRFPTFLRLDLALTVILGAFSIPAAAVAVLASLGGRLVAGDSIGATLILGSSLALAAYLTITMYRRKIEGATAWLTARVRLSLLAMGSMVIGALTHGALAGHEWWSLGDWTRAWLGLIGGAAVALALLDLPRRHRTLDRNLWVATSVIVTTTMLLGTVSIWTTSDDARLLEIGEITAYQVTDGVAKAMNAITSNTSSTELGLTWPQPTRDEFEQLLTLSVSGHDAIKVAAVVDVAAGTTPTVKVSATSLNSEAESALANMLQGSPAMLEQAATSGLTYVGLLGLPLASGGDEPFAVMASPIPQPGSEIGTAPHTNVVVVAISLVSALGGALNTAKVADGEAFIDLYVDTPDGTQHVWSTDGTDRTVGASAGGYISVTLPHNRRGERHVEEAYAGTPMYLVARRGPNLGLALHWRRIILGIEGLLGGLVTFSVLYSVERAIRRERERLRRESLLAAALEGSPGWTAIIGPTLDVVMSNTGRHGVVAGMPLAEVDLFASDIDARRAVEDIIITARTGEAASYQLVWTDPTDASHAIRIFEIDARPLPDPDLVHLQCRDVTEHRDRAMRSAQSERMEAIGVLAGGLAHDFNNLLFITLGYLQMLERQQLIATDPTATAYVARAIEAVERGATVAKSLLSVARSQPLTAIPINLAEFLDGLKPLFEQALRGAHELVFMADTDGLDVVVDPGRLSSSLLNIAFNSRDAMATKGTLTIAARHVLAAPPDGEMRPMVAIAISDTGKGMSAEVVARAFEPFFTTKKVGSGTGLGLSTVYSFAQQSGGWASIESVENVGTTVTVFLPPALEHPARVTPESLPTAASTRALVVDDEPALAELVAAWLTDLHMTVKTANSPEAAMKIAAEFQPELLVSDANLGAQIDGLELARLLVERNPSLLVVFMTGFSDRIKALQAAGVAVLAKPFTAEDLVNTLSLHLGERLRHTK